MFINHSNSRKGFSSWRFPLYIKNKLNTCVKASTKNNKTKVASIKLLEENLVLRAKNISSDKTDVLKKQISFK